jgi:hypothetical protein
VGSFHLTIFPSLHCPFSSTYRIYFWILSPWINIFLSLYHCRLLSVCVLPTCVDINFPTDGNWAGALRKWLSLETGTLMDRISVLIKETSENCFPLLLRDDTVRRWHLWTRKSPQETIEVSCLDSKVASLHYSKNKCLLSRTYPVC